VTEITKEMGDRWHLIQTMSGDQTDGYGGVPGIGIKRAVALFEKKGWTWDTVVETFEEKGMTADDALSNARLAKILQYENFDRDTNAPVLWTPTSSDGADNGTTVQAAEADGSAA
jgi:DNA polymerase-1